MDTPIQTNGTGMQPSRLSQYLETEVMGADPIKLVYLLYRGAIDSVGAARRSLAAGDIAARSRQIQKAWDILQELHMSLDKPRGGKLGVQLAALYVYMQKRLLEANLQQADGPLEEVERLLGTLAEGWRSLMASSAPAPMAQTEYRPVSCSY